MQLHCMVPITSISTHTYIFTIYSGVQFVQGLSRVVIVTAKKEFLRFERGGVRKGNTSFSLSLEVSYPLTERSQTHQTLFITSVHVCERRPPFSQPCTTTKKKKKLGSSVDLVRTTAHLPHLDHQLRPLLILSLGRPIASAPPPPFHRRRAREWRTISANHRHGVYLFQLLNYFMRRRLCLLFRANTGQEFVPQF